MADVVDLISLLKIFAFCFILIVYKNILCIDKNWLTLIDLDPADLNWFRVKPNKDQTSRRDWAKQKHSHQPNPGSVWSFSVTEIDQNLGQVVEILQIEKRISDPDLSSKSLHLKFWCRFLRPLRFAIKIWFQVACLISYVSALLKSSGDGVIGPLNFLCRLENGWSRSSC